LRGKAGKGVPLGVTADWDSETDVLVVGAGGCGLVAALAAHEAGAQVAVVEKLERLAGNTALSTASVPAAGTRFQRQAGIDDDAARLAEDLLRKSGRHDMEGLAHRLAEISAELIEWLVDVAGARLDLIRDYRHVGHRVPRLHAPPSHRGQDLLDDLERAARARDIPIALAHPVGGLLTDAARAVTGAVVQGERSAALRIGAKKVILATNGFANAPDLVRRFCPDIAGAPYYGALGSTGDALRLGGALGAEFANLGAYQAHAALAYPHGSLMTWTVIEKGGCVVNRAGRRFGDESAGYSAYGANVIAEGNVAFAIYDARIRDVVAGLQSDFAELVGLGGARDAASLADLAAYHALDRDALSATIADYNRAAHAGGDAFGRRDFGLAPLTPPFVITRIGAGLFHTQGGLKIDLDGRVLRRDGAPIANLFAGGGAAAGISGRQGGGGYASGNGLLSALGLGLLAGRAAAREIAEERD
jgi:fumarate reductase flavoprotein subunit